MKFTLRHFAATRLLGLTLVGAAIAGAVGDFSLRHVVAAGLLGLTLVAVSIAGAAGAGSPTLPDARLQRVADQQQIERLIADYSAYLAARDFESYGALFSDGAFLGPDGQVIASGAEQIESLVRSFLGGNRETVTRHLVTNTRIDIADDGQTAQAESFLTTIDAEPGGKAEIFRLALYKDHFRKRGEKWTFASRQEDTAWVLKERVPTPTDP